MTRLLIIRHGNTFDKGDSVRRVGVKTDIPLSSSGRVQAENLGRYLKDNNLLPDAVYTAHIIRAKETADILLKAAECTTSPTPTDIFNEIDHGVDEFKTDEDIIARIGKKALEDWNDFGLPPDGFCPSATAMRISRHPQ